MYLTDDPRPPLPEWIQEAGTVLTDALATAPPGNTPTSGIPRDQAVDVLLAADDLELEPADAAHAIDRLLDRGYFYEVDDELRVTMPAEHGSR